MLSIKYISSETPEKSRKKIDIYKFIPPTLEIVWPFLEKKKHPNFFKSFLMVYRTQVQLR